MLNEFIRKKEQLGVMLKSIDEVVKLKRYKYLSLFYKGVTLAPGKIVLAQKVRMIYKRLDIVRMCISRGQATLNIYII